MLFNSIIHEYSQGFKLQKQLSSKGIGIECELPIVDWQGEAVSFEVIEGLFEYLEKEGFTLKQDVHTQNGFCYYNARLVSKFGTVENRMCCQQPPRETMVTSALTLGVLENLEEAETLVKEISFVSPKQLRMEAIQYALDAQLEGKSIVPYLRQLLQIAEKGLKKRGLGEENFLAPLFERLNRLEVPADVAIRIFEEEGREAFLEAISFKSEEVLELSQASSEGYEKSIF